MRASFAAPAPFDCSPRAMQNEALSTKARKVIECMQRRWLNATFCQWADRAQTRSTDGVAEGPVIMIVKKANSAVQRSARPDAVQPDEESMKERDEHAALEEMGTTMRVQQEQIAGKLLVGGHLDHVAHLDVLPLLLLELAVAEDARGQVVDLAVGLVPQHVLVALLDHGD